MKHVDETLLHALLDGQLEALEAAGSLPEGVDRRAIEDHVRRCAGCRVRLEEERMIRDGAALVLRDAALTTVDVPPFDMVAPEQPQIVVPRRRPNVIPLAWAATVVLALGAGWWGSVLLRQEQPTVALEQTPPPPAVAEAAPARGSAAAAAADEAPAATAAEDAAVERAPQGAAGEGASPGARAERTLAARESTTTGAEPSADAQAPAMPRAAALDPVVSADQPRMAAASLPDITTTAVGAERRNTVRTPAAAADLSGSRLAGAQPGAQRARTESSASRILVEPVAPAPEPAGVAAFSASDRADESVVPPQAFHDAVRAARLQRLAWNPVDQADSKGAGVTLVHIAGVPPLEAVYASPGNGGTLARVVHRLDDGARLDLLIWRSTTAISNEAAPPVAQAKAETAGLPVIVVSSTDAPGGRELLTYLPSLGAFVLLGGDIDPQRLAALATRLIVWP